jgi:regulator of protease activity HflC (stomatin/prohibitin superfamily)
LRLPPPFDRILREQPARVRTLEIGLRRANANTVANAATIEWNSPHARNALEANQDEFLLMTGDRSLVELAVTIQYRITDLKEFRFAQRAPERLLRVTAESAVREVIARHPLLLRPAADPAPEPAMDQGLLAGGRSAVERQIAEQLQQRADALHLGVEISADGVCLQDVHPPLAVVDAFRDVSAAYKEREKMNNEADTYRRDKLIQAAGEQAWRELSSSPSELTDARWESLRASLTGEAYGDITAAQSYAQQQTTLALGDARSFVERHAAHQKDPRLTEWRLFMDTVGVGLANRPKLLLDRPGEARRHLLLGVPPSSIPRVPMFPQRPVPEEE